MVAIQLGYLESFEKLRLVQLIFKNTQAAQG